MARPHGKIIGKITDQYNNPLPNLRIEAWDSDSPDADDSMGYALTNSQGNYSIQKTKHHGNTWDTKFLWTDSFRPDIYIKVKIRSKLTGNWIKIDTSATHNNEVQKEDTRINRKIVIAPDIVKETRFKPAEHGFKFRNSYDIKLILSILGMDIKIAEGPLGLCGGMSAAALARYKAGLPIPNITQTPNRGPLFEEIWDRQVASLTSPVNIVPKIMAWQASPNEGHQENVMHSLGYRTKEAWRNALRPLLDRGFPTILVLIRARGLLTDFGKLKYHHQVVALGYIFNEVTRDLTVMVYDPNDPGVTHKITLNLRQPRSKLDCKYSHGSRPVRGFFVNPNWAVASSGSITITPSQTSRNGLTSEESSNEETKMNYSNPQNIGVIKHNYSSESFNRDKLKQSIINAGASKTEAETVTNEVANRIVYQGVVQSKDISRITTSSLSRVNPVASKNYTKFRIQKNENTKPRPTKKLKAPIPIKKG